MIPDARRRSRGVARLDRGRRRRPREARCSRGAGPARASDELPRVAARPGRLIAGGSTGRRLVAVGAAVGRPRVHRGLGTRRFAVRRGLPAPPGPGRLPGGRRPDLPGILPGGGRRPGPRADVVPRPLPPARPRPCGACSDVHGAVLALAAGPAAGPAAGVGDGAWTRRRGEAEPAGGRRLDRAVRAPPRAGAREFRPRVPRRAGRPGRPPGRGQDRDPDDPRALAAGPARHAHIVEIVSHAVVNDGAFQLICMPFWGGDPADVLAAPCRVRPGAGPSPVLGDAGGRARRGRGPATGADLLAALDAVGAPEYPSVHPARPAREILAPLSYDRAIAWVIARLAEALDHASSRDVAHGDVKPSNILLSADGNPMLLDFNLARDGSPAVDPWAGRSTRRDARLHGPRAVAGPGVDDRPGSHRAGRRRLAAAVIRRGPHRILDRHPDDRSAGRGRTLPTSTRWGWSCWRR